MPYAIITFDKPDHLHVRTGVRDEHIAYLKRNQDILLAAGGLTDDDGNGGSGGVLLIDTEERAEAERFVEEDPFTKAGLFEKVVVSRWRKAFFNGECLLPGQ